MRNILTTKSQRHLKILEFLINNRSWTTIQLLSEQLNFSYQMLRDDIDDINTIFTPMKIETSQKYGIRLNLPETCTVDYIYQKALSQSIEFELFEMLFFNENLTVEALGNALFISASTVTRIINHLKHHLRVFNLSINSTPSMIVGDERNIRYLFMNYFLDKYSYRAIPFPQEQIMLVETLMEHFIDKIGIIQQHKLKIFLLISLTRIQKKHRLPEVPPTKNTFYPLQDKVLDNTPLIDSLAGAFDIIVDGTVIAELFFPLFHPHSLTLNEIRAGAHEINQEKLASIRSFVHDLEQFYHVTVDNFDELVTDLYNAEYFFFEHDYFLFNRKKRFIDMLSMEIPYYSMQVKQFINNSTYYGRTHFSDDFRNNILYLLTTHWNNLIRHLNASMQKVTVGILGELDKEHSVFLSDLLADRFSKHIDISSIERPTIAESKAVSKDYDLIVTTLADINWQSTASFAINLAPSPDDFNELESIILELVNKVNVQHIS